VDAVSPVGGNHGVRARRRLGTSVATPLALSVAVPMVVEPVVKTMVPVGVAPVVPVTVATRISCALEPEVVELPRAVTVGMVSTTSADGACPLLAKSFASPL